MTRPLMFAGGEIGIMGSLWRSMGMLAVLEGAAMMVVASGPALAQAIPASGNLQQRYDAAFQETLRRPADMEVLFSFAALAVQAGDIEGAISAFERMLLVDPAQPRIRLELGVLYYRLGSYEVARAYLEAALASEAIPAQSRAQAEQLLADAQKKLSPSRFSGEFFFGTRYQSNANLGPATSNVRLFGQTANLNQAALGRADWGAVGSAAIRHVYDFGRQDGAVLETQFSAYANRQFQVSTANVALLDLTSGPRFRAFRETFEDVSIRPFATFGYVWVNDTPYYGAYGAGVEAGVLLADGLRNTSIFTWRQQAHDNTWYLPTNNQLSGMELSAITSTQYQLTNAVQIFATANAQRFQTGQTPWQNYQLWGVGGGVSYRFGDPLFKSHLTWTINLSATLQWWNYDAPDPVIDPATLRYQTDTILNVALFVPFDERTTLSLSAGRFVRAASLPNYEFSNNSAMIGVSWRF
jgi:tetratricopeptide (TPR) repeat protein